MRRSCLKRKKNFFCFQGETHIGYGGLATANFALTLLYPNTWLWKGEPGDELEDLVQHHFPMALTTKEIQEIEII